jgi:hypothetical protein
MFLSADAVSALVAFGLAAGVVAVPGWGFAQVRRE